MLVSKVISTQSLMNLVAYAVPGARIPRLPLRELFKRQNPNFSIKLFRNRSNISQAKYIKNERINLPSIRWQSNKKYI